MEDNNYILFESYLSGELSSDEVAAFESRLETQPEFNQAFKTYKDLSAFLENKFENKESSIAFKANLKKISDKHFYKEENRSVNTSKPKVIKFYKYAIAASIALLLGIFTFQQFSDPSYGDYADHDNISLMVRGVQEDLMKEAEDAFNQRDYMKADEVLSVLIEKDEANIELKFYKAIANIELNKFEISDYILEEIKEGNSVFRNKAIWYLALSKLKQEDHAASLEILRALPKDADDFEDAQKLIKKLD